MALLGHVAGRSPTEGFQGDALAAMRRHENHRNERVSLPHRREKLQAVEFRHHQVGDDDVGHRAAEGFQGSPAIGCINDRPARFLRQQAAHEGTIDKRIIDD